MFFLFFEGVFKMKSQEFEFGKSDDYYCGNFYNFLDKDKAVILAKKCDTFLKNNGFKKFRKVIINSEFDSDNYRETWYIAADVFDLLNVGGDIKKLHVKQNISSTGVILKGVN